MMHDLELAGYVPKTRIIYLNSIRDFAKHFRRSPAAMGADEVRAWVDRIRETGVSRVWMTLRSRSVSVREGLNVGGVFASA
jgi:hypothetical protein